MGVVALAAALAIPDNASAGPRLFGGRFGRSPGYAPSYGYSYGNVPSGYGYYVRPSSGYYVGPSYGYYPPSSAYVVPSSTTYVVPTQPSPATDVVPTQPAPPAVSEVTPAAPPEGTDTRPAGATATVTLLLPAADAEVWVDGRQVPGTGTVRRFESPALRSGESYAGTLRVRWPGSGGDVRTETRQVSVYAGDRVTVDFTRPAPTATEIVPREYPGGKP